MSYHWLSEWVREKDVLRAYPREFSLNREVVYDDRVVKENGVDEYMSVFSLWQRKVDWYDVILFDIDGDDAYWKFKDVRKILVNEVDIEPSIVYFSGRGFHIYLWFDGFIFNNYGEAVRKFAKMIGLMDYLDLHVIGDKSRMARIPHTYNIKSGLWMMKINPNWTWAKIKGESKMHNEPDIKWKKNSELAKILKEIDGNLGNVKVDWNFDGVEKNLSIVDEYFSDGDESKFPLCIQAWMKEIRETKELDHVQRFNLAIFLLHVWGYEKTMEFFRENANDFKEKYTEYQLKYMIKRKLKMYSCKRLKEVGLCKFKNQKECPFYPTLNQWVKWR